MKLKYCKYCGEFRSTTQYSGKRRCNACERNAKLRFDPMKELEIEAELSFSKPVRGEKVTPTSKDLIAKRARRAEHLDMLTIERELYG